MKINLREVKHYMTVFYQRKLLIAYLASFKLKTKEKKNVQIEFNRCYVGLNYCKTIKSGIFLRTDTNIKDFLYFKKTHTHIHIYADIRTHKNTYVRTKIHTYEKKYTNFFNLKKFREKFHTDVQQLIIKMKICNKNFNKQSFSLDFNKSCLNEFL